MRPKRLRRLLLRRKNLHTDVGEPRTFLRGLREEDWFQIGG